MADYQRYATGPLKGGSPTLQPAFLSSIEGLRVYQKDNPQAIPRLYNGICVCIVVNDRICVMAVRLTGANRVILQKVYDYAGSKT